MNDAEMGWVQVTKRDWTHMETYPSPQECIAQSAKATWVKDTGLTEIYRRSQYLKRQPGDSVMTGTERYTVRLLKRRESMPRQLKGAVPQYTVTV
jgi:hypothetical protein